MSLRRVAFLCGGLLLVSAAAARAQYGYYPSYHASTAAESYARGMADVIRSAGSANLDNSVAAQNYEQARSMNMQNHLQYEQTYFEMRKMNESYRAQLEGPPVTAEQAARISASRMPDRLSVSQLDPVTGKVNWPTALQASAFDDDRQQIESLLTARAAASGSIGIDAYQQIQNIVRSMQQTLQSMIHDMPTQAYISASKFLTSLSYEAGYASQ